MTKPRETRPAALDAERMALFLEGRLPPAERARLLEHLAGSADDLAVFADAAAAAREIEPAQLRTPRWRTSPGVLMAIAAALLIVAIVPLALVLTRASSDDVVSRYVTALADDAGVPADFEFAPWSATRSTTEAVPESALPWRLGARLVDVEVALNAGDTASALRLASDAARLLEMAGVPAAIRSAYTQGMVTGYGDWSEQLRLARGAIMTQLEDDRVELGAWIEAGRFAAANRDQNFFRTRDATSAIDRLRARGVITPALGQLLDAARRDELPDESRWRELAAGLQELLASR